MGADYMATKQQPASYLHGYLEGFLALWWLKAHSGSRLLQLFVFRLLFLMNYIPKNSENQVTDDIYYKGE